MKILLIGDFSGIHTNLSSGLEAIGHEVVLASDGNGLKGFNRHIDLKWNRRFRYLDIFRRFPSLLFKMRGFDVVQLVGIPFVDLRPRFYFFLFYYFKRMNKAVFVGSNTIERQYLEYADKFGYDASFLNNPHLLNDPWIEDAIKNKKGVTYTKVHQQITRAVNGITACCCEYYLAVSWEYPHKAGFLPLPYNVKQEKASTRKVDKKINILLGKQGIRSVYKGMDVIENALIKLKKQYSNIIDITIVDSIPYQEYLEAVDNADIVCDQLYSYGAGLSAVIAMAKGKVVLGGGESEMWRLFGVEDGPIVNLPDDILGVIKTIESLILDKKRMCQLSEDSRKFALKYHSDDIVAQQYVDFWKSKF